MLKFLIEAYDNLAYVTVVDKHSAVLQVVFAPGQKDEVRELLDSISLDLGLEIIRMPEFPPVSPSPALQASGEISRP